MEVLLSRELPERAVRGVVGVGVHQAGDVQPCGIARKLDGGRRRRQAVVESRGRRAGNGLDTEAFGLLIAGIPVGVAVLLNAVCHGLEPSRVVRVALGAGRTHRPGVSHISHAHVHVPHIIIAKSRTGEVEGRERIVTCLAAQVREQGDPVANNAGLVSGGGVDER